MLSRIPLLDGSWKNKTGAASILVAALPNYADSRNKAAAFGSSGVDYGISLLVIQCRCCRSVLLWAHCLWALMNQHRNHL